MANKRIKQRGAAQVVTALAMSALAALLAMTGCSAGSDGENLGERSDALMCGLTTCPADTICGKFACVNNTCVPTPLLKDGSVCGTKLDPGACIDGYCCQGCLQKTKTGAACSRRAPTDVAACGVAGTVCSDCTLDACETPICTTDGVCANKPIGDGDACSKGVGACFKGACCAGCLDGNGVCQPSTTASCGASNGTDGLVRCVDCSDKDACTAEACVGGKCDYPSAPDGTSCLDANKCDGAESCSGGVCKEQAGFMCPTDTNVCHAPQCDPVAGCSQKLLSGVSCADANKCNGAETCNNGVCSAGTPLACNDNNPCTKDSCDAAKGCVFTPLTPGESCDNNNLCDGVGICDENAKCVVVPSAPCDDKNPCTDDQCDPAKGCVTTANSATCNDGDPCTTVDKCSAGSCLGSVPLKCDDGNSCTSDACVKNVGCATTPLSGPACNDGNNCSTGDKCVAGVCTPTGGKLCDPDTNPCTVATCEPAQQTCGQANDNSLKCQVDKCHAITQCVNGDCPTGAALNCDDANPCTKDDCDDELGCTHVPDDMAKCDDGDLCTEGEACRAGKCVVKDVVCEAISDCHKAGSCNPKTGRCDTVRADVGTPCDRDTGKCDANGTCVPNPTGEGGAGGEAATGDAGQATGGTAGTAGSGAQGGGPVTGEGGEGNSPTIGGESSTGASAGKGTGATPSQGEGGEADGPRRVFVREPGGCSCNVPVGGGSGNLTWLAGLALAAVAASRRHRRTASSEQR